MLNRLFDVLLHPVTAPTLLTFAMLWSPQLALADSTKLCVPPGNGVPGKGGPPEWLSGSDPSPQLDDPRWRGATAQAYGMGGTPRARVRAVHKDNRLYASFQVMDDPIKPSGTTEDSVYIALAQNAGSTHHLLRLRLTALSDTAADASGVSVSHYTWNTTTSVWDGAGPPTWLEDTAAWLTIHPDDSAEWAINAKIDYTGLGLAPPFKLWTGTAVQVTTSAPVLYDTHVWPLGTAGTWTDAGGGLSQDVALADWGDIEIGTGACSTGVSLTATNIGVKNGASLGNEISTINNNVFAAWPTYNGVSTGVGKVTATFRIANWGSTTTWTELGGDFVNVPSAADGRIERTCIQGGTPACPTLAVGQPTHQCVLVELASPQNVTFLSDSVYRNMNFVDSSYFERYAEISTRGLAPLAGGAGERDVYLHVKLRNMPARAKGGLDPKALRGALRAAAQYETHLAPIRNPTHARLTTVHERPRIVSSKTPHELVSSVWPTYEVQVYHDSGQTIQIGETQGRRLIAAPAFGYYVYHHGELSGWLHQLAGAGIKLQEVGPNLYKVQVPENGSIKVATRIEAVEPGRPPILPQLGRSGGEPQVPQCPQCQEVRPPKTCDCGVLGASPGGHRGWILLVASCLLVWYRRRRVQR